MSMGGWQPIESLFPDYKPAEAPPPPKADQGDFLRGGKVAFQQLPQMGYGITAGIAAAGESALGEGGLATDLKNWAIKGYKAWGDKIQSVSKESDSFTYSWDEAKKGNIGALVDFLQYGLGYAGGQAVQMLATAGVGSIAAKATLGTAAKTLAEGMVSKEITRITATDVAKEMTADQIGKLAVANVAGRIGETAAIGAMAFGQEGGEIFGGLTEQNQGRALTGAELAKAFGATLAAGGLEFVGDKLGLDILTGKLNVIGGKAGRIARGIGAGAVAAPIEGGTEYLQTGIEEFGKGNEQNILPFNQSAKAQTGALDAAALGAIGGAAMGGIGGAIHTPTASEVKLTGDAHADMESIMSAPVTQPISEEDIQALPRGSFAKVDELAQFAGQEKEDLASRRDAIAKGQEFDALASSEQANMREQRDLIGQQQTAKDLGQVFKADDTEAAYRQREAQIEAQRARDFVPARDQKADQLVDQANALTKSTGIEDAQPTAMQLALQRAMQKSGKPAIATNSTVTPAKEALSPAQARLPDQKTTVSLANAGLSEIKTAPTTEKPERAPRVANSAWTQEQEQELRNTLAIARKELAKEGDAFAQARGVAATNKAQDLIEQRERALPVEKPASNDSPIMPGDITFSDGRLFKTPKEAELYQKSHPNLPKRVSLTEIIEGGKSVGYALRRKEKTQGQLIAEKQRAALKHTIQPHKDNLWTAIDRLGGLNRKEVKETWGIDRADKYKSNVFGSEGVIRDNGHSIDSMLEKLRQAGYRDINGDILEYPAQLEEIFHRGDEHYHPIGSEARAALSHEAQALAAERHLSQLAESALDEDGLYRLSEEEQNDVEDYLSTLDDDIDRRKWTDAIADELAALDKEQDNEIDSIAAREADTENGQGSPAGPAERAQEVQRADTGGARSGAQTDAAENRPAGGEVNGQKDGVRDGAPSRSTSTSATAGDAGRGVGQRTPAGEVAGTNIQGRGNDGGGIPSTVSQRTSEIDTSPEPVKETAKSEQVPAVAGQLYVERDGKRYPVDSLQDARQKWNRFRDQSAAGASEIGEGARIIDQEGNTVARISYNGIVWPPGKWQPGMKPLLGGNEFTHPNATIPAPADAGVSVSGEATPGPRDGEVGQKLTAGEVVKTATGRLTTPFPNINFNSNRAASGTLKKVDAWLMSNALAEARARGDEARPDDQRGHRDLAGRNQPLARHEPCPDRG